MVDTTGSVVTVLVVVIVGGLLVWAFTAVAAARRTAHSPTKTILSPILICYDMYACWAGNVCSCVHADGCRADLHLGIFAKSRLTPSHIQTAIAEHRHSKCIQAADIVLCDLYYRW